MAQIGEQSLQFKVQDYIVVDKDKGSEGCGNHEGTHD